MPGVIEPAASGRAKCKGCRQSIPKGDLRLGDKMPNPYGEGEATAWFHLVCGACRRPETFVEAMVDVGGAVADEINGDSFLQEAITLGVQHPRLPRLASVQRSPSGRARCRHCRETIDKDLWRVVLEIWEDGRFAPIGFIHLSCAPAYFETDRTDHIAARVRRLMPELPDDDVAQVEALLGEQIRDT